MSRYILTFDTFEELCREHHGRHFMRRPPYPDWYHSSSELLLAVARPEHGGLSGNDSRYFPSFVLKVSNLSARLISAGRMFQSLAAFTEKDCSYSDWAAADARLLSGGTFALVPSLG